LVDTLAELVTIMPAFNLNDDLYSQITLAAAASNQSVDDFAAAALRAAVDQPQVRLTMKNGFPIFEVSGDVPPIDPERVKQFIAEEGF
jgi:hypothetical protein